MDNLKIYDTQLNHLDNPTPLQFLDLKQQTRPLRKYSINSAETDISEEKPAKLLPTYSFNITSYQIGQHVEYSVLLKEEYKILRRKVVNSYSFSTRYSMLESLDRKLGGKGLPGKKLFGNKSRQFVEKRKGQLERYLNRVAESREAEFYKFIKQIKDVSFNQSLKGKFSLE